MTTREQIIRLFRMFEPGTPLVVRDIIDVLPRRLSQSTVTKECTYLTKLGMLTAKMVENRNHGRRYKFWATRALCKTNTGERSNATAVNKVLGWAREPLTAKDIRYAVRGYFGLKVSKSTVQDALEKLTENGVVHVIREESEKYPSYQRVGRGRSAPWRVLDAAMRTLAGGRTQVFSGSTSIR